MHRVAVPKFGHRSAGHLLTFEPGVHGEEEKLELTFTRRGPRYARRQVLDRQAKGLLAATRLQHAASLLRRGGRKGGRGGGRRRAFACEVLYRYIKDRAVNIPWLNQWPDVGSGFQSLVTVES